MDGTILNDLSHVSEYTRNVLIKMTKAGNKLVLSSGRPLVSILGVIEAEKLDFEGIYVIANNGSTIYDCDKKEIILKKTVPMDMVSTIWNYCLDNNIHIQTYTEDSIVTAYEDEEIGVYKRRIFLPVIYTSNPKEVLKTEPYKLLAINLHNKSILDNLQKHIIDNYGDKITAIFSNDMYLEVINASAGKGSGLVWLCNHLAIDIKDSYAAGDAMNDLSMLEASANGIAMCNGDNKLFKAASIISEKTNDEDGLAHVIEKYIL